MSGLVLEVVSIRPGAAAQPLFAPLDLTVAAGSITTLMGASGIGKSTLVDFVGGHLAAGFEATGRVLLGGRDVTRLPAEARRIGILFQDALLFPHLSVGDNLSFGLAQRIGGRRARRIAVEAALDQAGLGGFHDRDPATLSGGQRARAALMRTLMADPAALLLDEPFSKLDPALRSELREFVFDHVRARAIPVLLVSHDREDASAAGGPVVLLAER
ncbi:MAG: ATP-binding cassette domain-containing protein [Defluviimonas sp.]|uniref:ATP-binding cassette domain-containing protein n=1 Tax=Albidovulum sp. TaxID=1872424 RepID=UPI001DC02A85|nr:ATP-binding cassette domain-containing protein [Paracoccaceae bacterium]MCC0063262.1 ATP-binding cassette domain-containing protein [Defluviimonas sp.]